MKKLFYILSQKEKIKVDVSQYSTFRLAYKDGNINFNIDNHHPTNKQKYNIVIDGKLNKDNMVLEGILDVPQVSEYVNDTYNTMLEFKKDAYQAKENLLYYVQWNNHIDFMQKDNMARILDMVEKGYRVTMSPSHQLMLADYTNTGVSPNNELHIQVVKNNVQKDGSIKKEYPDLCPEEIVSLMALSLKKYPTQIEKHLKNIEIDNNDKEARQKIKYCKMLDIFKPLTKEDIEERLL